MMPNIHVTTLEEVFRNEIQPEGHFATIPTLSLPHPFNQSHKLTRDKVLYEG